MGNRDDKPFRDDFWLEAGLRVVGLVIVFAILWLFGCPMVYGPLF